MANNTLRLYQAFARYPGGKWLFSVAVSYKAPYFATIRPRVLEMSPQRTRWAMRKRWRVQNHIGTVHALAMGNLCEVAAGTLMECAVKSGQRWIPKGMDIRYLAKAQTDLIAEATLAPEHQGATGDLPVAVDVQDLHGQSVVHATIYMYVSEKPARGAPG